MRGGLSSNDAYNVVPNVLMSLTCDLLECGNSIFEVLVPGDQLQSGEMNLSLSVLTAQIDHFML